mmetsp:Transcript_24956/g.54244  ORF Transcript_24956/g.54244 Transcript_24956/m.54244 type:complete len:393 (+) Transcript_24956:1088-2266(+)
MVLGGELRQTLAGPLTALGGRQRSGGDGAELEEGGGGTGEGLLGLLAGEYLDGFADTSQLLGAEAASLAPLLGLHLAGTLRLLEELLVGVELRLGGIQELLALGESLALLGFESRLGLVRLLQGCELLQLSAHQSLEGLLAVSLLGICLLQVAGEGVIHALQDALDLGGLGGIIAERVLATAHADLSSAQTGGGGRKICRLLHEASEKLGVLGAKRPSASGVGESSTDPSDDTEKLGLLHGGLQELACACTGQSLDSCLKGADALLGLRLLARVVLELPVPNALRLALGVQILLNVLLQLLDFGSVSCHFPFQLDDGGLQLLTESLTLADVRGLASKGVLAPAGILVVGLLLLLAIRHDASLHFLQQLDDLAHRSLLLHSLHLSLQLDGVDW